MHCLIVFRSMTHAQSALRMLAASHIAGDLIKPPLSLGRGSCSHAVRIAEAALPRARQVLKARPVPVGGVYLLRQPGQYEEVAW